MTATLQQTFDVPAPSPVQRLWQRQLHRYPNDAVRYSSLAIVVATTVILYYQQYLAGGVATSVLRDTHMSFTYYVNITVVASIFGSLASLVAGLADRYGRANIVTIGLGVAALLTFFAFPEARTKLTFAVLVAVVGFIEGIVLVATPALIRDFSPQLGRASAMGFWTLGPVLGSLLVSGIVTPTYTGHRATTPFGWDWEYRVAGIISLVVFVVALVGLRELSPALRDQIMVSEKDRALIEMRAKGLDIEASLKRPFRQMMRVDIVASALAISVFLIIYYIAVGFFPIFFQTVHGYSASRANGLGNWIWAFDALGLVVIGYASDKIRVRKPFMIVGGLASVAFTTLFALRSTDGSNPSHTWYVIVLALLALSLGVAYAPWMASFTETAERHNPALTATGLAVWGTILRIVIAVAVFIAPHIVNTVSPIIEKGGVINTYAADPTALATSAGATTVGKVVTAVEANAAVVGQVQAYQKEYPALATAAAIDPQTLSALNANPGDATALAKALGEISAKTGASQTGALQQLVALSQVPKHVTGYLQTTAPNALGAANFAALSADPMNPQLKAATDYLAANGATVQKAVAKSSHQWRSYFWVAVGGEVVFIPLVFLMAGYWSPRKAREAEEEHEAMVAAEMAKLHASAEPPVPTVRPRPRPRPS